MEALWILKPKNRGGITLQFPQELKVHLIESTPSCLALDINTSALIEISPVVKDLLKRANRMSTEELYTFLCNKYPVEEVEVAFRDIQTLKERKILLSQEEKEDWKFNPYKMDYRIGNIALNLTHDCNMRCKYCYAGEGNYGGPRTYMTIPTAERSIDFLFECAGPRKYLSITFFGGEPLMNFDVLKFCVLYANDKARSLGKEIEYTVITNGTLLTNEVIDFLNEYKLGVQISIDGPPGIQDYLRPFPRGVGSSGAIEPKIINFTRSRGNRGSVRATLTRKNLNLVESAKYFLNLGFTHIHFEPVTVSVDSSLFLDPEDFPILRQEYEKLAQFYLEELLRGHYFGIEGFTNTMSATYSGDQRWYGCGVGRTYIAITPTGDIYPCHRFQGMKEWKMGDIYGGIEKRFLDIFLQTYGENFPECNQCWLLKYCGGGCVVESLLYNNAMEKPPAWHCYIRRVEAELGLKIYQAIMHKDSTILDDLYGRR